MAAGGDKTIVVLPPEFVVYLAGVGATEPLPEPTKAAKENLQASAASALQGRSGFRLVELPQLDESAQATLREHVELFKIIAMTLDFTVKTGGSIFLQIMVAAAGGVVAAGGGSYVYCGVIDLRTGQLIWYGSRQGVKVLGMGSSANAANKAGAENTVAAIFKTYPESPGLNFKAVQTAP